MHDNIADAYRLKELRSRKDFRGRLKAFFDGSQGWILAALVGCVTATIAYSVDVLESPIFDYKEGYCGEGWYLSEKVILGPNPGTFHPHKLTTNSTAAPMVTAAMHGGHGLRPSASAP